MTAPTTYTLETLADVLASVPAHRIPACMYAIGEAMRAAKSAADGTGAALTLDGPIEWIDDGIDNVTYQID